jgi:hypothetical protein
VLQLELADTFKVPSGDAEDGSTGAQMVEDRSDCRQSSRTEIIFMFFNMAAHGGASLGYTAAPRFFRYAGQFQAVAQYAYIRVTVCGHSVQIKRPAGKSVQRAAKCEIMHRILALEQGPVYIKEVGVVFIPGT